MGNRSFFNALNDPAGDFLLATVIDGPAQGANIFLRGSAPVWPEPLSSFWAENWPVLEAVTTSGTIELARQRVFVERFGAAPQLVVCGGGHVGVSVVQLVKLLGMPVTALEDRPEYADDLRSAGADTVLCQPFEQGLARISGGQECYFVVVTRAHSYDVVCLRSILQKPAAYVGMMGSKSRSALVRTQLAEMGLPQARIDALHAPIGLASGGNRSFHPGRDRFHQEQAPADRRFFPGTADSHAASEYPCCAGDHRCTPWLHAPGGGFQNVGSA